MIYLQIHISVFLLPSLELVHRTVETESLTESHEGWLSHDSLRKGWSQFLSLSPPLLSVYILPSRR